MANRFRGVSPCPMPGSSRRPCPVSPVCPVAGYGTRTQGPAGGGRINWTGVCDRNAGSACRRAGAGIAGRVRLVGRPLRARECGPVPEPAGRDGGAGGCVALGGPAPSTDRSAGAGPRAAAGALGAPGGGRGAVAAPAGGDRRSSRRRPGRSVSGDVGRVLPRPGVDFGAGWCTPRRRTAKAVW